MFEIYHNGGCEMIAMLGIKRKLGKEIFIYPFQISRLKGVGYNLAVGDYAWSLISKRPMITDGDDAERGYWVEPNETALVLTKEVVAVSKRIGGTFHSKVDRVSEGFSSISTTLDPGWIGPLLIAITNIGTERRKLKLGESFVTLIFNELEGATDLPDGNPPGRFDRLNQLGIEVGQGAVAWLNEPYTKSAISLKEKITAEKVYANLGILEEKVKKWLWNAVYFLPTTFLIMAAFYAIHNGASVATISAIVAAIAVTALQAFITVTKNRF
jgi:deoxycytidine triphosphate deaminase